VCGISLPEHANVEKVFTEENIAGPDEGSEVKGQQLSGFVELGMLDLGQVELAVDLVQEVFLNDLEYIAVHIL
jgi:hypothetical protein